MTTAEIETNNMEDIVSVDEDSEQSSMEGSEIWCRGICNIDPNNCSDEEERNWIQCYKCGGWWHQEHANLECMSDNYIKLLKWCCESIGIDCPGNMDFSQSPLLF